MVDTKKIAARSVRAGFTIIEIMAVIVIIGLLAGMVSIKVMSKVEDARIQTTKASLKTLDSAIQQFKMDTSRFPTEEEGLLALVEAPTDVTGYPEGGYLNSKTVPKDAWRHDFVYLLNPEPGIPFEIVSYGADGEQGGEGHNADLKSNDAN